MSHQSWLKPRRRLYLVRHGAVRYVDDHGHAVPHETVALTSEGRTQAERLARDLADIPFDRVLSSDQPRCLETANLLMQGRPLTIEPRAELREIQPGKLRELPRQSIEQLFVFAFGKQLTLESQFLMGETFGAMLDRVLSCFSTLLADRSWRHLLVVAHGGVNRAILAHALGLGVASFGLFEQDACCLNVIDVDDNGSYLLRLLNHTGYNPAKRGLEWTAMEQLFLDLKARQ